MRKTRSYAEVYNDVDGEIVNLFRMLRDNGPELSEKIRLTPYSRDEYVLSYQKSDDPIEQARRTLTRSLMGFGSNSHSKRTGFRGNAFRNGTPPSKDWTTYPASMVEFIERLRGVIIENREASRVLDSYDSKETLVYADPPYVHNSRSNPEKTQYRFEMTDDGHVELSEHLHRIQSAMVISGYSCELYNDLYSDWERVEKSTYADGAKPRTECLWLKQPKLQGTLFTK